MDFDPTSAEFRKDPYPVFAYLRDEAPVGVIPSFGVHYLSRHADVLSAFKQPRALSSSGMLEMIGGSSGMMGTQGGAEEHEGLVRGPKSLPLSFSARMER